MKRHRSNGRRKVGGVRARCGVPEPVAEVHYLTKSECQAVTRKPSRNRNPRKPLFGQFRRHALYAIADASWLTPVFLIPRNFRPMSETHSIQLIQVEMSLYRGAALAKKMGVGRMFVTAMKRAGYRFTHAHQTTLESALAWRAAFPSFRSHLYLQPNWKKLPKLIASESKGIKKDHRESKGIIGNQVGGAL